MERLTRGPLQGTINIVRFNWHFYVLGGAAMIAFAASASFLPAGVSPFVYVMVGLAFAATGLSLAVSFYVYDVSNLYELEWLGLLPVVPGSRLLNINAGFDETSAIIGQKYGACPLTVFDFYDSRKHTEVSIERARKAYAVFPGTISVSTRELPLADASTDFVFAILAAHEIRIRAERIAFFEKLQTSLAVNGRIVVVEHLRDLPNFVAYNFGFFHFFPRAEWKATFDAAGLVVEQEIKVTPFVSTFILKKHGTAS